MREPSASSPGLPTAHPRVDWRFAVVCAVALTLIFSTQGTSFFGGKVIVIPFRFVLFNTALNWALWLALLPLILAVVRHLRGRNRVATVVLHLLVAVGISVFHSVALTVLRWSVGLYPNSLRLGLPVIISITFATNLLRYGLIAAAYHAFAYYHDARDRDVREARLAASLAEARLATLEGRLHPHFLFNTLNTITALIRKDPPAAAVMVGQLSDLLRASLDAEPGREVTLAGELALLERYTSIQRARFSDRLSIHVAASPEALGAYVPHMVLQPIVENAIRHGIAPREARGTLTLEAAREGSMLRLVVRDDGVGFGGTPAATAGRGIGIAGTRQRLTHFYGDQFSFDIADATPTGTVVTIDLPFHTDAPREPQVVA